MTTDYLKLLGGLVLIGFGAATCGPAFSVFIITGTAICTCIVVDWKHKWELIQNQRSR